MDFKSNALTTRPKQLVVRANYCGLYSLDKILESHKESDFLHSVCNYRINFNQIVTSKLIIFTRLNISEFKPFVKLINLKKMNRIQEVSSQTSLISRAPESEVCSEEDENKQIQE